MLNIGDTVLWRGTFGSDAPEKAVIETIDINCVNKDGDQVDMVQWSEVNNRSVMVSLTNGHWAYGTQIEQI